MSTTKNPTLRGRGIVKAVLSGDTIIVIGLQITAPPEMQLNISCLSAPRIGNRDKRDEPFAWASREFLRRKCIGRHVYFRKDYDIRDRGFATVFLLPESNPATPTPEESGENLGLAIVSEGWAKVKQQSGGQGSQSSSPDYDALVEREQLAEQAGKGLWTKDSGAAAASIREVKYEYLDVFMLYEQYRGKRQHAVVEFVRDGATVRALLLPTFTQITLHLAGIQCPQFKSPTTEVEGDNKDAARVPEPYALEAKHFTETRVLHRDVGILIQGVDSKYNTFFGSIYYGEGPNAESGGASLGEDLLTVGLAKVVEWSAKNLGAAAEPLRAAERTAKEKRLRMWKDWVPSATAVPQRKPNSMDAVPASDREYPATVLEVVSGDTLVVLDLHGSTPVEKRVTLASVRAPKMVSGKEQKDYLIRRQRDPSSKPPSDEPWAWEAKEFLRTNLVGKKVSVQVEFMRSVPVDGRDRPLELTCVSVLLDGKNVAEQLAENGLVKVVRHSQDEERSVHYAALMAAEQKAKASGKGILADPLKTPAPIHKVADLTAPESRNQAKSFFPLLQRKGLLRAIVAFANNGARFKVYIPSDSCLVNFVLSGVRCPNAGRFDGSTTSEPFAEEALLFTRSTVLQHDVEIQIEAQDRMGSFVGSLFINKKNLAVLLLEQGLAKLHDTYDRCPYSRDLERGQDVAKAEKKKLWTLADDTVVANGEEEDGTTDGSEVLEVLATEILDGSRLYARLRKDGNMEWIENQVRSLILGGNLTSKPVYKEGDVVLAQFSADDEWYRAKIERVVRGGNGAPSLYEVVFSDYGNRDSLPAERLHVMDPSLLKVAPQAQEMVLAGIRVPTLDEDYGFDAAEMLKHLVWDRPLAARIYGRDTRKCLYVALTDEKELSVNSQMVRAGLARAQNKTQIRLPNDLMSRLKDDEEFAKRARANLWQYGDIGFGSDEEEEAPVKKAPGKAAAAAAPKKK